MFQFNLFLQLLLASLAFAAPVDVDTTGGRHGNAWQYGTGGGVVGFAILILDIIVISPSRPLSSWQSTVFRKLEVVQC